MGQPARRSRIAEPITRSSHLRLVKTAPAPERRAATRSRARVQEARSRSFFMAFACAFACLIVLGGARVTLISRAAEYSLGEKSLLADIKEQRVAVDRLEVDRSALSTPSRIAGIASASMSMGEPRSVKYISSTEAKTPVAGPTDAWGGTDIAESVTQPDVLQRVVEAVVDLSAGEAQTLLVGDLGLAGSR